MYFLTLTIKIIKKMTGLIYSMAVVVVYLLFRGKSQKVEEKGVWLQVPTDYHYVENIINRNGEKEEVTLSRESWIAINSNDIVCVSPGYDKDGIIIGSYLNLSNGRYLLAKVDPIQVAKVLGMEGDIGMEEENSDDKSIKEDGDLLEEVIL